MKEIWKDIGGYEGLYEVSNLGRIKSLHFKESKILKNLEDRDGYLQLNLTKNNKQKLHKIHRLVVIQFIENPLNKPEVNHKNGIKTDNRVENLEWVNHSENMKHGYRKGFINNTGEKNGSHKLNKRQAFFIRNSEIRNCKLAKMFNVSEVTISNIKKLKIWI